MKRSSVLSSCVALFLMVAALACPRASQAQVSLYGDFSATYLHNLVSSSTLYGATTGILVDGPSIKRMLISADLQGRFVAGSGKSLNGLTVGPRFSFPTHNFTPFAELLVGFARIDNGAGPKSTDSTFQINGGIAKRLTPRLDAVVDYSYAQYFYSGGQYNPKTFSIGAIYHFTKR